MNIGIVDSELIYKKKHNFPNLACMKISSYHKSKGDNVKLLTILSLDIIKQYDIVYISKVFTDTKVPKKFLKENNVIYGGTGFFYDKAKPLESYIEHSFPDYHLYDDYVNDSLEKGAKQKEFVYYTDYSIGFTTRGCFRKCQFCVNKRFNKVSFHSPLDEFVDYTRKYICLLDDNFLGYKNYASIFASLNATNKRFQFKQGLDERLLTVSNCKMLLDSKYLGDFIFAFDNIDDKNIIEKKLIMWNETKGSKTRNTKFYVLCGYDREHMYDENFFRQDIINTFERIKILMKYKCLPYIMRHKNVSKSPYQGTYINLASWCNQPSMFKKKSYREYCEAENNRTKKEASTMRYLKQLEQKYPEIATKYFDMKY